jgi:hypothetical protein
MTIFRSNTAVLAICVSMLAVADAGHSQPRNHVEEMLLLDVNTAKQKLENWIVANPGGESAVTQELLEAGFVPDKGSPQCRFYSYYRKTGEDGSARTSSIALCDAPRDAMVLVLDMLPHAKRKWTGQMSKGKVQ